jgi:hypothetical protein
VKTDTASGMVNDPNDWSADPRYIIDLLRRIVTVSLETMKIVDALPALDIIEQPVFKTLQIADGGSVYLHQQAVRNAC